MKPNFRWKKTDLCADNAVTSNEDIHSESILTYNGNEDATNIRKVANGDSSHHVATLIIKDPEAEGRKPKCFCSSQVTKTRTRWDNSWCIVKNIFNWRPDWRGSFVFVVIVVCLLSRTTLGAINSDSSNADGDDKLIFNARRLSSLESDSTSFLQNENSNIKEINESGGKPGQIPCGKNEGVHVKIQYSTSIVENGNEFHVMHCLTFFAILF